MNPLDFAEKELRGLAETVRAFASNHDVRVAYHDRTTTQMFRPWETIAVWFGSEVGEAAAERIADLVAEWLKGRFRHDARPKALLLARYEGNAGLVYETREIKAPEVEQSVSLSGQDARFRPVPPVRS